LTSGHDLFKFVEQLEAFLFLESKLGLEPDHGTFIYQAFKVPYIVQISIPTTNQNQFSVRLKQNRKEGKTVD
jgi:hypothetical protein